MDVNFTTDKKQLIITHLLFPRDLLSFTKGSLNTQLSSILPPTTEKLITTHMYPLILSFTEVSLEHSVELYFNLYNRTTEGSLEHSFEIYFTTYNGLTHYNAPVSTGLVVH